MRTLTQVELLALWETGRRLHPLDQGVLAVETAFPQTDDSVADWPIGRRNRALAELRCNLFGPEMAGWTACVLCAEKLEFALDARALAESPKEAVPDAVEVDGVRYRLPTSRDLARLMNAAELPAAAVPSPAMPSPVRRLLAQLRAQTTGGAEAAWNENEAPCSPEQTERVGAELAMADPLAEIRLSLDCPSCGASFEETLDLPSFLWAELEAVVRRLLLEVHRLASAYGWSEGEILGLGSARREFYLAMVGE